MRDARLKRIAAYTLSRVEAYLIVGLVFAAIFVALAGGWPGWIIAASVAVGLVLMALLFVDSLSDPQAEHNASIADIEPGRITDPALRNGVRRALEYVRAIQKLAQQDNASLLDAADEELPQLEQAARSIYQMSIRLQEFRADRLIQQDLAQLRLSKSQGSPLTSDQAAQLETLERLDNLSRTAEQEIASSLAQLGRSYAELQAINVTPEIKGRAADALHELKGSTKRLAELASSYDEVFSGRAAAGRS